jgi:hypothetical protein
MSESTADVVSLQQLASTPLQEATAQEIQLELIRRRRFHAFDGQQVAKTLLGHRELWESVMMERVSVSNPGRLPTLGLVKLRDLRHNDWNVDTLYVLTRDRDSAKKLADLFRAGHFSCMVQVHEDPEEVDSALGGGEPGQAVVSLWWD